jgi:hypothetical protein
MEVVAAKMRAALWLGISFSVFEPVLNIATTKVSAVESKRLATNQRDGLGFNLTDVPCGLVAIHKLFRRGVPENNVGLCSGTHKPIMWR